MIGSRQSRAIRGNSVKPQKDKPKSVWNSLEIAKLIVASFTSLSVATVGAILSIQASNSSTERDKAARQQSVELARLTRIVNKRSEVWDMAAPLIDDLVQRERFDADMLSNYSDPDPNLFKQEPSNSDLAGDHNILRRADRLLSVNAPYFSQAFRDRWADFRDTADAFTSYVRLEPARIALFFKDVERARTGLENAARRDLALDPGTLLPAVDENTAPHPSPAATTGKWHALHQWWIELLRWPHR